MKFDNLKIAITDEVQLKAICDVLESMGYIKELTTSYKPKSICTYGDGTYHVYMRVVEHKIGDLATLTDLLAIRDKQIKEKIHAQYEN